MAATKRKSAARTVDTLAACKDSATVYEARCVLPLLCMLLLNTAWLT